MSSSRISVDSWHADVAQLRVLVADDSMSVRARLRAVLLSDPGIDVVGEAADGAQAIEMCGALRPDVVTMDMMMPVHSGLSATKYIMSHWATPILIVSSSVNRGELFNTYEALAAGAVDVMEKPRGDDSDAQWDKDFLARIRLVARIPVISHPRTRRQPNGGYVPRSGFATPISSFEQGVARIVAIGTSTGGPGALVRVIGALPLTFPPPVLVVLHLGAPFAGLFAEWLSGQTGREVRYARDQQFLSEAAGQVVLAPPDCHMIVQHDRLRLTHDPERHSCRPSVDVLFESLARERGRESVACLLTGMGKDGAAGLAAIHDRGGVTIAQDEATSVVYGMPREAALLGAVDHVLPLDEIGPALASMFEVPAGEPRQ